jgi:hypothetical protein
MSGGTVGLGGRKGDSMSQVKMSALRSPLLVSFLFLLKGKRVKRVR